MIDEKARNNFLEAAFSDAVAIYQLSLAVDFDYSELREREYPLLAPQALRRPPPSRRPPLPPKPHLRVRHPLPPPRLTSVMQPKAANAI